jgi:exodeoxyribonuclease VII large subunit
MNPEGSVTLAELLNRVSQALKKEIPGSWWIMAEVLEINVNRSGHCYLELIEKSEADSSLLARARATIWASRFSMLRPFFEAAAGTPLKSGIKILCRGSVEFHPLYGLSINITDIDPAYTLGDLARKKQEVILRLRSEGVMEMNRELTFPEVPQHIALISSRTAAGYGDFRDSLLKNIHGYAFRATLFEAVMQGDSAPASIICALDRIHMSGMEFDCVVIARGGGAKADLECYNDYDLAYYITQFPLPVITGIGHERDESVADLVAARSLKTPTAVAEFLVDRLMAFEIRLTEQRDRLTGMVNRLAHAQRLLLERLAGNLMHASRGLIRRESERLRDDALTLEKQSAKMLSRKKEYLDVLETRRSLVDPVNVLKRGYSYTLHRGRTLRDVENVAPGDLLETRLHQGTIISVTQKTTKKDG